MTHEELTIMSFLDACPGTYYARKEIARKAVRRSEYEQNQHWVDAPLNSLLAHGAVEQNEAGLYRAKKGRDAG